MGMREQLKRLFSARAARLGTLAELSKLAPVAIIAETLGYHPVTMKRHAVAVQLSSGET
jgi:formate dehydrogenase maturation protein FdhE